MSPLHRLLRRAVRRAAEAEWAFAAVVLVERPNLRPVFAGQGDLIRTAILVDIAVGSRRGRGFAGVMFTLAALLRVGRCIRNR